MKHSDVDIILISQMEIGEFENDMIFNLTNALRIIKHRMGPGYPCANLEELEPVLDTLWKTKVGEDYKERWDNLKASNDPFKDDDQRHNRVRGSFESRLRGWAEAKISSVLNIATLPQRALQRLAVLVCTELSNAKIARSMESLYQRNHRSPAYGKAALFNHSVVEAMDIYYYCTENSEWDRWMNMPDDEEEVMAMLGEIRADMEYESRLQAREAEVRRRYHYRR